MSRNKSIIHSTRNKYTDRQKAANQDFPPLSLTIATIDTMLLLLDAKEEQVLITVLKHITEYIRRHEQNINLLKTKNMLDLLARKEFYRDWSIVIVKRLALYLGTAIIESMNTLEDMETSKTLNIVEILLKFFNEDGDDFCLEYITVMFNKCMNDPQAVMVVLKDKTFIEKFFFLIWNTNNPDLLFHSLKMLYKMLLVQCIEDVRNFFAMPNFPIDRIICDLTCNLVEIRFAALNVLKILISETDEPSPFAIETRSFFTLEQLTKMYCEHLLPEDQRYTLIDVMATAMRNESMAGLFFDMNLYEHFLGCLSDKKISEEAFCYALSVLVETCKYAKHLPRLIQTDVTEKLLGCLLKVNNAPPTHIILGLNRLLLSTDALWRILDTYNQGLLLVVLKLLANRYVAIKTREQLAEFLVQLLNSAYQKTATEILHLEIPVIIIDILQLPSEHTSIDLNLQVLAIVESLAQNADFREELCSNKQLVINLATLLTKSFSNAILVSNIFRCLGCLVEEASTRTALLNTYMAASIKRALKSVSNMVKTAVTNFIMQTARFPEFVHEYIENGVLEVLIFHQKYAFCVPTWNSAIESILSKNPTLKFCVRNHLGFTDITSGEDFFVSKFKYDDYRILQQIIKDEVSPIHPLFVVNFKRNEDAPEYLVKIPQELLMDSERNSGEVIFYCRRPGDTQLPEYLKRVYETFHSNGLMVNPINQKRCIDFDNIAKRAKIIADIVAQAMGENIKLLDLNAHEECSNHTVNCHLKDLAKELHSTFIPLGKIRSGCLFERAVLFKGLADQVGLPCTLQRSVDGRFLFNEIPLPIEFEYDVHCDKDTLRFMPWRMLRPTHIIDLMFNVGSLYPIQSRQALQYLRLY